MDIVSTRDFRPRERLVVLGVRLAASRKIYLIYTTGSPWTSFLIGVFLKLMAGLPLVSDFRDPWTWNPDFQAKENFFRRFESILEHIKKRVLGIISRGGATASIITKENIGLVVEDRIEEIQTALASLFQQWRSHILTQQFDGNYGSYSNDVLSDKLRRRLSILCRGSQ